MWVPRPARLLIVLLILAVVIPLPAAAGKPWPARANTGFHLIDRAFSEFTTNQVYCNISLRGEICTNSGNQAVGGGYWPKGSADGYVFASGLQVAGIIQGARSDANPWGGDTTGGFFFDAKGTTRNGAGVAGIYDARDPVDVANWPDLSRVPLADTVATLFDPGLRGRISASEGDLHFVVWEGDPAFLSGRTHPLGVLADFRVMGWNYPNGNDDIVYFIITLYNISSTRATDYAQHRPAMRTLLLQKAADFQSSNNARFGITLPVDGYTIGPLYAGIGADNDVGTGTNFGSVNLPFAMGYTYQTNFFTAPGWTFDPAKYGVPFFPGVGFVGIKFLNSGLGAPAIQLFSDHSGGGTGFPDAANVVQLYRYLSAGMVPDVDRPCNYPGIPAQTHICLIQRTTGTDVRQTQSWTGMTLAPGQSASLAVAYIFAAPVALAGFVPSAGVQVDPGDPTWTNHPDSMLSHAGSGSPGVNRVDSITGFLAYTGQTAHNGDGSEYQPTIRDFRAVPRSLLGKAQLAQAIFDGHFLLPAAPQAPDFFLIPGDKQVTILWKPSASDAATPGSTGDAFFALASAPSVAGAPNMLYDPNYRRFDVEGYRIFRGRTDDVSTMRLLMQFDYAGTAFSDYGGNVPLGNCAPELGSLADCRVPFTPGVPGGVHQDHPLYYSLVQVRPGDRAFFVNGTLFVLRADTLVTGGGSGYPHLSDNGVPFVFTDRAGAAGCVSCGVSNGLRYFYAVTAFDANSFSSGPSSLESPRVLKSVTAGASASNYSSTGSVAITGPYGRNVLLTDDVAPTIDPSRGKFSKKQLPTNAGSVTLGAFITQILKAGEVAVTLDSITYVSVADGGNNLSTQWFSANGAVFSIPITINTASYSAGYPASSTQFLALPADAGLAASYGGGAGYSTPGVMSVQAPAGYLSGTKGRGCVNGGTSSVGTSYFGSNRFCTYQGPRWFIGDNETMSNPNSDTPDKFDAIGNAVTLSNVGELAGVSRIFLPLEYFNTSSSWRVVGGAMSGFITAADYRLYWGAAGHVDSVVDLTHNTVVPFKTTIQASWGILNNSAVPATTAYDQRPVLTFTDIGCVAPFKGAPGITSTIPCTGTTAELSQTAIPGPVSICVDGTLTCNRTAAVMSRPGFVLYLKGEVFVFELGAGGLPAAGTAWTMRDYVGGIQGGSGVAGNNGPYIFTPSPVRPFTAPGLAFKFAVQATNELGPASEADLARIHTVPDPYYMSGAYDLSTTAKIIKFVNLPAAATIRIYTTSGRLVRVLRKTSEAISGTVDWDVRDGRNRFLASGVYFYTVEADGVSRIFRLTIVNYTGKLP